MPNELNSTIFANALRPEDLRRIEAKCVSDKLYVGDKICSGGDVLKFLYIVHSGCLKATVESQGKRKLIGYINSGDLLGQFSLLFDEPIMGCIEAEADSVILKISKSDLDLLVDEIPGLRQMLLQSVSYRVRSVIMGGKSRRFARRIGFVRHHQMSNDIFQTTACSLGRRGEKIAAFTDQPQDLDSVTHFPLHESDKCAQLLRRESGFDRSIADLIAEPTEDFFRELDQLDEIYWCFRVDHREHDLALLDELFSKAKTKAERVKRVCLLPQGELVAPSDVKDPRIARRDFILPHPSTNSGRMYRQGLDRIFRHLCDIKIGIALAGGGARGLVHFGVLRALEEAGVSFDMISGTSAGSMFGLTYATGMDVDYALGEYTRMLTPGRPYSWFKRGDRWFLLSKYRRRGWDSMLRPYFHDWTFERLPVPFYSVTVDLVRGKQVVDETGDIILAMLASLNLPGISKPILRDGMALVDGGVLNNLPVSTLTDRGADFVVGVKVSENLHETFGHNSPGMKTEMMRSTGELESLFRVLEVMSTGTEATQFSASDLLIEPKTAQFSFTDFTQGTDLAAAGASAVEEVLPRLKSQISELLSFRGSRL